MTSSAPIFIVGVGRSGSTVFHRILSGHPDVAWLSTLLERNPGRLTANRMLMHGISLPLMGHKLADWFEPAECYPFWDREYPGFSVPCRDLVAGDVTNDARTRIIRALGRVPTSGRPRLLIKITGWPRIGFLREIFPEARFIHILRDGRPVAASFLKVDWWWGWRGPSNWRWGELSQAYQDEWNRHGQSFVALAGIQWKILMDAYEEAKPLLPADRLLEIKYEDVCRDPATHFQRAAEFTGLPWNPRFADFVTGRQLRSENEKWRKDLTQDQQATLEAVVQPHLRRYGYQ